MYDVLVIGGGVIGCAIARELSRRSGRVCVVERNEDVCTGTSKANSAIVHAGFDAEPGTRKARFNVEGSRMMEALSRQLDFPYRRCGALVLCLAPADREKLQALYQRGLANGVEGLELVEGEALHRMEPALSQEAVAALYAPTSAILCPFGLTIALAENAAATAAFAQSLEALGIPYLYVNAPQKLQRGEALLPTGVEEYGNESADAFLEELERQGTDYVDLRPLFEENGIYSNWFFRTDHHWKPEAAFFAWQALTDELEGRYGLAADPALTDPANWDTRVLEHFFLGSQGKRVGSLYAGADDITLYTPKFDTELTYSCPAYGFTRTGPFETSVCFPERVAQQDWFNGNPYTYYAGGDYPIATITNHKNPDGPRVVLLRDSFACALTPFLALSCSELTTIDLRYFEGDLLDTIAGLEPDIALTLYAASTTRLDNLFQYEHTEE